MYYTGTFKCAACDATLVVERGDWADMGSGVMTTELRERIKGWSHQKGTWCCPLHKPALGVESKEDK